MPLRRVPLYQMTHFVLPGAPDENRDWDEAIRGMLEVIKLEPEAADTYYYLGEVYRLKGDYGNALQAYQGALEKNQDFGPAYVGMARARLASDSNANVLSAFG